MNIETFNTELRQSPLPVIVDVWAPWCAPYKMIKPALHTLSQEYAGRVDVWKVNADENGELLRTPRIYGIPALLVFHGEQEITHTAGVQPQASLTRLFEAALIGETPKKPAFYRSDRLLRAGLGLAMMQLTWFTHQSLV